MGSQNSSSNSVNKQNINKKGKDKKIETNTLENHSNNYLNDSSSYKGVNTETTSVNEMSGTSSISDKGNEVENITNDLKIPTLFQWKEEGNNIIITGSFCGWNRHFPMKKNEKNNIYELLLYLPQGEYQFKFIIDGIWKCSNFYKTVTDQNGNTNNYLDNTIELNKKIKEIKNNDVYKKVLEKKYEEDKINININRNNVPLSDKMKKVYGIYFPKKEHLNLEPPRIPQSYILPIDMYNYVNIGNKNFIYDKMKNNLIKMNYKITKNPPHIYLNHIFNNCFESENYIRSNINFRVRSKFTCLIYYNPKKQFCIKKNE